MSLEPRTDQERAIIERFKREICEQGSTIDPGGELDWYALSIGFFLACGLNMDDAGRLACWARYSKEYWQPG